MEAIDESAKVYKLPNVLNSKVNRNLNLGDPCIIKERFLDFSFCLVDTSKITGGIFFGFRFLCCTNAAASSGGEPSPSTNGGNNLLAPLVELWQRTVQPLGDYGFGKRSVWEGGVGLFMVSGAVLLALALAWLRGFQLRSRFRKYNAVFEFSQACGICVGTPLRIRGVTVGNVVRVDSSLKSIDAYVEVEDDKIIVPRNSLVEVNQSGLLMETMIDITPKDPLPTPSVGPLDADCSKEGLILCDKERMKGHQGVSLDALVGIFTRLGRDMEEIGVQKSFKLAEKVASIMEEAQPLLSRIEALAEEVQPLLSEVRESDLVKDVETIAKGLAEASGDLSYFWNWRQARFLHVSLVTFRASAQTSLVSLAMRRHDRTSSC
ncbi:hypothetical protein TRIUR3_06755 [Triticum urartu]|uniref:Mce/MlaD domain-containing protein n=1 Tax=Triticum urartu TaxID=4572 RepID=M7YB65_TRIUA|nr:hypothetical protein TRIUR3_06755 [Triticum urartu]